MTSMITTLNTSDFLDSSASALVPPANVSCFSPISAWFKTMGTTNSVYAGGDGSKNNGGFLSSPLIAQFLMNQHHSPSADPSPPAMDEIFANLLSNNLRSTTPAHSATPSGAAFSPLYMFSTSNNMVFHASDAAEFHSCETICTSVHHDSNKPTVLKKAAAAPSVRPGKKRLTVSIPSATDAAKTKAKLIQLADDDCDCAQPQSEDESSNSQTSNMDPFDLCQSSDEGGRRWRIAYVAPAFQGKINVDVTSKTRCEQPMPCVPEKLYSSLKYEIRQKISGSVCQEHQFLLGKITCIDQNTGQEILKDQRSILTGIVEGALTKPVKAAGKTIDEPRFEGILKSQFTSVSYHHQKASFCWRISYHTPENLEDPIMQCVSAPFTVLARKASTGKKRRRSASDSSHEDLLPQGQETNDTSLPAPTTTTTHINATDADCLFDQFKSRLDEIVHLAKKLKPDERTNALQALQTKLQEHMTD